MKLISSLKGKYHYIVIFITVLLILSCIRKDWENPFDPEDSLDHKIEIISSFSNPGVEIGVPFTIEWISKNVTENISIALCDNSNPEIGEYLILIADSIPNNNNGNEILFIPDSLNKSIFNWDIPWNLNDIALTDSTGLFINIYSTVDPESASAVSDNSFDLFRPQVEVKSPIQHDEWYLGRTATITWDGNRESNEDVKIELYLKNASGTSLNHIDIITENTNDLIYKWDVPETLIPDTLYTVKMTSNINPHVEFFRNNIHVKEPPNINVDIPSNDNRWVVGQEYTINWNSDSLMKHTPNIRIECWKDSAVVDTLAISTLNNGEFNWQIPWTGYKESKNYQIKIISIYNESIFDTSSNFEIDWPDIEITYPNAITVVRAGHRETISWNTIDYIPNIWINLHNGPYQDDYDSTKVYRIEADTPNIGEYNWNIKWKLEKSNQYWIRIACPLNYAICDTSVYFTITLPDIQSVSPTEWITLQKGQDYIINWINYEFPDTSHVGIELWKDGNMKIDDLNDDITLNIGEFNWTDIKHEYESGEGYQIKVFCIENDKIERMSNRFKIID